MGGNDAIAATNVVQQTKTVKGKVLDDNGEPIIGASVKVVGTTNGAVTDLDGNFTLSNVSQNAVVEVSYIGYISQKIKTSGQSSLNVSLKEDNQSLEEVVVGYGVQRKTDVTGAMTRVGEKELNSKPVSNAFEALQGKAAGVDSPPMNDQALWATFAFVAIVP